MRRCRGDEGSATAELVVAFPMFLFMLMLIVQAGLYFHAVGVASAAAQEGARAARHQGATIEEGEAEATEFIQALAPRLFVNPPEVNGDPVGTDRVRMTVSGQVIQVFVIPGANIDFTVRETSEGPVERFRPSAP